MVSLLLPVIYLAFISLGLPDALLGAAITLHAIYNLLIAYGGAALGIMTYVFRVFSPYECAACCALLIVSSIPEWLDLISHRTERIRFMREEEQRLANSTKPE